MNELVEITDVAVPSGIVRMLTLQRPSERNPLDHATVRSLGEHVKVAHDDPAIRVVVLTGSGSAFSAGGDMRAYIDLYRDVSAFRAFLNDFRHLNAELEAGDFISIAMVNGPCVAGGLELALACDLITIADSASIGDGHIRTGQIDGAGGSQRLVRAVGIQRARQLMLTGKFWSGTEAVAAGLALFSTPLEELHARTLDLGAELAAASALAMRHMKTLLVVHRELDFEGALSLEIETAVDYATTSNDAIEGLLAFVERRTAKYLGC